MQHWNVLPIRNEQWLCRRSDAGIVPVRPIPRDTPDNEGPAAPFAVNEDGWSALGDGKQLTLLPPNPGQGPVIPALPEDLESIGALAFHGGILYVGASSSWQDTSRLGWIDVCEPAPTFHPLPAPNVVGDPHRPIFAILASHDRLIALDAAFTPKLAVTYDISDPRDARCIDHVSIPSGLDDHPVAASLGRSYVAILTNARQDRGRAWKIGIFDFDTMDEIATFYEHADWNKALEMPLGVTMHEDLLLIARDMMGVGVVRLDDRKPTRYEHLPVVSPWAQTYVPVDRITYVAPLGQGHVTDVQPTGDPTSFAVTMKRGGRTWWEEIELG